MNPRFSLVYPTRHRPEFVRQALSILERQGHDSFEVIVCDNFVDAALSCEQVAQASTVANVRYVRPPEPVGMVENWNYALKFARGDYICYFTDKMFVLPGALRRIERAIESSGGPEIVSWTTDAYDPNVYPDYFGAGRYFASAPGRGSRPYGEYSPAEALDRRGRAEVARGEQDPADYVRGKIVFGAYRRELVQRIVQRYGLLFHNVSPDYTSMILGLTEASSAVELRASAVVSVNTNISNGVLADTSDAAALRFLSSLGGGLDHIFTNMLVPGLYVSQHNVVAHDYLSLRRAYDLGFEFDVVNWLALCVEDVFRPSREWSDPRVEAEQKSIIQAFTDSLDRASAERLEGRLSVRAAGRAARATSLRARLRPLRRLMPGRLGVRPGVPATSVYAAVCE